MDIPAGYIHLRAHSSDAGPWSPDARPGSRAGL